MRFHLPLLGEGGVGGVPETALTYDLTLEDSHCSLQGKVALFFKLKLALKSLQTGQSSSIVHMLELGVGLVEHFKALCQPGMVHLQLVLQSSIQAFLLSLQTHNRQRKGCWHLFLSFLLLFSRGVEEASMGQAKKA